MNAEKHNYAKLVTPIEISEGFRCSICGEKFAHKYALGLHKNTNHAGAVTKADVPSTAWAPADPPLKLPPRPEPPPIAKSGIWPGQTKGRYECADCGEVFDTPGKYGMHRRWKHPPKTTVEKIPFAEQFEKRFAKVEARIQQLENFFKRVTGFFGGLQ